MNISQLEHRKTLSTCTWTKSSRAMAKHSSRTIRRHATSQHNLPDIAKMSSWCAISKVPKLFEKTTYTKDQWDNFVSCSWEPGIVSGQSWSEGHELRVKSWINQLWDSCQLVWTYAEDTAETHYQTTASEDLEVSACAVVRSRVHELVTAL
jgi:hypothetical protein